MGFGNSGHDRFYLMGVMGTLRLSESRGCLQTMPRCEGGKVGFAELTNYGSYLNCPSLLYMPRVENPLLKLVFGVRGLSHFDNKLEVHSTALRCFFVPSVATTTF